MPTRFLAFGDPDRIRTGDLCLDSGRLTQNKKRECFQALPNNGRGGRRFYDLKIGL